MKKEFHLAKKYLIHDKWKTAALITILAVTIIIYMGISSTFSAVRQVKLQQTIDEFGSYHFILKYLTQQERQAVRDDSFVKQTGAEWVLGMDEQGGIPLILIYREDEFRQLQVKYTELIEGREPERRNEVAVTQKYMEKEGWQIGDTVKLSYEKHNFGTGEFYYSKEDKFHIVGILDDSGETETVDIGLGLVSEELLEEVKDQIDINQMTVVLESENDLEYQIYNLYNELNLNSEIVPNYAIISILNESGVYLMIEVLLNITVFLCVCLIVYNLLYFNLLSKNKDLGIMRALGYLPLNLSMVIIFEVFIYLLLGIPIGLLLGYFVSELFLNQIVGVFIEINNVYAGSLVSEIQDMVKAVALIILTMIPSIFMPLLKVAKITPMDVIRGGREQINIRSGKLWKGLARAPRSKAGFLAMKNLERNKKRTRITVLSMLIVSILTSFLLVQSSIESDFTWVREFVPGDYKIEVKDNSVEKLTTSFSIETYNKLKELDFVEKITAYKINSLFALHETQAMNQKSQFYKVNQDIFETNIEMIKGTEYTTHNISAYGVENMEQYLSQEFIDNYKKIKKPIIVIDKEYQEFFNAKIGDEIALYFIENSQEREREELLEQKVVIGGFIDEFPLLNERGNDMTRLYIDLKGLYKITGCSGYDKFDLWVKNDNDMQIRMKLNEIGEISEHGEIVSHKERVETYAESERTNMILQLVFNIIMAAFTLVTLYNTIYTGIVHRKKEFVSLFAIGITKKELQKCIMNEGFFYGMTCIIMLVPFQIVFLYIFKNLFKIFVILKLLALNLGIIAICSFFSYICFRGLFRKADINILKVD